MVRRNPAFWKGRRSVPASYILYRGRKVSQFGRLQETCAAAAAFIRNLVGVLRAKQMLKPGLFLNVNVPAGERKGVRVARLSVKPRSDRFERRTSPLARPYFWPVWEQLEDDAEGTDVWAFVRGFITVTPMTLDVTAPQAIEALETLDLLRPALSTVR